MKFLMGQKGGGSLERQAFSFRDWELLVLLFCFLHLEKDSNTQKYPLSLPSKPHLHRINQQPNTTTATTQHHANTTTMQTWMLFSENIFWNYVT